MSDEQKDGKVFVTHSAARDAAYAGLGIPDDANHLNLYQFMGNCADSTLPMSIAIVVLDVQITFACPIVVLSPLLNALTHCPVYGQPATAKIG